MFHILANLFTFQSKTMFWIVPLLSVYAIYALNHTCTHTCTRKRIREEKWICIVKQKIAVRWMRQPKMQLYETRILFDAFINSLLCYFLNVFIASFAILTATSFRCATFDPIVCDAWDVPLIKFQNSNVAKAQSPAVIRLDNGFKVRMINTKFNEALRHRELRFNRWQ